MDKQEVEQVVKELKEVAMMLLLKGREKGHIVLSLSDEQAESTFAAVMLSIEQLSE